MSDSNFFLDKTQNVLSQEVLFKENIQNTNMQLQFPRYLQKQLGILLRFNKYFLGWHNTSIKLTQSFVAAIPSVHIYLAIWRGDLQADSIHTRCVRGLLCAQPHCYEHGEVLCHCVSTAVTKSVHRISGQVCCGFDLVPCPHPSPAPVLDTGQDRISGIHNLKFYSRFTKRLATNLMGFTFGAFLT